MSKALFLTALAIVSILPAPAQAGRWNGGGHGRMDFLAGYLGLTDDQKTQARSIFSGAAEQARTASGQLAAAREALRAAVKAGQSEAELDKLAAAVGAAEGQLAGIRAKADAKFYALLTPEQKQKYDQLRTRFGAGGRFPRR